MNRHTFFIFAALLLISLVSLLWECQTKPTQQAAEVTTLRCEYLENPPGIDEEKPRLSWVIDESTQMPEARDLKQTAYQVLVASSEELLKKDKGDLWDSRKVASDQSIQVEYAGTPLESRQLCYWKVRIWDQDGKATAWSTPAHWSMGLLKPEDFTAKWIGVIQSEVTEWPKPRYLRREFTIDRAIRRATVYATALGLYELWLNGQRVGDHQLAPEWTDYYSRVQVQTYDVTPLLRRGANAIGAALGNGWYCGGWQYWEKNIRAMYGSEPSLLVQLEIEFADGQRQTLVTDDSWRGMADGPLRFTGIYEGVTGDAQFFMRTAVYNMDVSAFFNKWLVDVCQDAQMPDGHIADRAPHCGGDWLATGGGVADDVMGAAV